MMPPAYVKPYVKRNKTDAADAAAICEAVSRPTLRFVPIKTVEQQAAGMGLKTSELLVRHALQRLVVAYVLYDRSLREVAEHGAVTKPKRGNAKAIARTSPHFSAMRELASDAAVLEAEFGLSPRRRSAATKAERKT